eukprot:2621215-Prymnesium_polylepis.1
MRPQPGHTHAHTRSCDRKLRAQHQIAPTFAAHRGLGRVLLSAVGEGRARHPANALPGALAHLPRLLPLTARLGLGGGRA